MDQKRRKRLEEFCRSWDEKAARKLKEGRVLPKKEIFERLAWELSRIPYSEFLIQIGCNQKMVEFYINTGIEKFMFSCAIYEDVWDDEGDVCFTTVELNDEILKIHIINLDDFVEKILEIIDEFKKEKVMMTTDELFKTLPSHIGNHPVYDENGEIESYLMIDEYDDIEWFYLHNDGKDWLASYGIEGEFLCMNPTADEPPFDNAFAYGKTPQEAMQKLYNWCVEHGFIKKKS